MEANKSDDKKRLTKGILFGVLLLILSAGIYAMGILMVSVMVMGCTKVPPEWVFMIVFVGFPLPLIISTIVTPLIYIKRQRWIWMVLSMVAGLFLSCVIFFIWFIFLTQHC